MPPLTTNTKAILLLTAPLIVGRGTPTADLLSAGEYKVFAQRLQEIRREPADLIGPDAAQVVEDCSTFVEPRRLQQLLGRGLQLGQAVDRWRQRAVWVVSRADDDYPKRLKGRLRGLAPAVLYGCGEVDALNRGGLAIVGSRHVEDKLVDYTMEVASLAARADRAIISGGAKGIDQAAMRGALDAGGRACGVLTDSLERQTMTREHRDLIVDGRLILVSPYDPNAGFNAGHAMQRNKVVYALADAALVVSSDVEKGGTWAGATEQLGKLRLLSVYVRSSGTPQRGLDALRNQGALPWPNPETPDDLLALLDAPQAEVAELPMSSGLGATVTPTANAPVMGAIGEEFRGDVTVAPTSTQDARPVEPHVFSGPAQRLFETARALIGESAQTPIKEDAIAKLLNVTRPQAKAWLDRLVQDGVLQKRKKPVAYVVVPSRLL